MSVVLIVVGAAVGIAFYVRKKRRDASGSRLADLSHVSAGVDNKAVIQEGGGNVYQNSGAIKMGEIQEDEHSGIYEDVAAPPDDPEKSYADAEVKDLAGEAEYDMTVPAEGAQYESVGIREETPSNVYTKIKY